MQTFSHKLFSVLLNRVLNIFTNMAEFLKSLDVFRLKSLDLPLSMNIGSILKRIVLSDSARKLFEIDCPKIFQFLLNYSTHKNFNYASFNYVGLPNIMVFCKEKQQIGRILICLVQCMFCLHKHFRLFHTMLVRSKTGGASL